MARIAGKVAFITGAASGIGAAVARELARRGADLALLDRREEKLRRVCSEIEATGRRAVPIKCDVSRDGELERAAAEAREALGRIDIAFACAGVGVSGRVADLEVDEFRRQFETNVYGVVRTVRAVHRDLVASRGCLAVMGSVQGLFSPPGHSPYSMSKAAVHSLAQALWYEYRPLGVGVVLIVSGFVDTEFHRVDRDGVHGPDAPSTIPSWLPISAERAARKIVKAILKRRRETVLTIHGNILVFLQRHFPGLVARLARRWLKA